MPRVTLAEKMQRAAVRRERVEQEESQLKELARKARTQQLIALGTLVAEAGLDRLTTTALKGGLAQLAREAEDGVAVARWERESNVLTSMPGDARIVAIARFPGKVDAGLMARLRMLGFRLNRLFNHWEGKVERAEAEVLIREGGGTLSVAGENG